MIIDYVWIKTDVSTYSIHLNRKFNYTYNFKKRTLEREKNEEYISNLYGSNIENIVAVIGENGAGKSTFLKVLMEVLDGNKFTNYMYTIVGSDKEEYFFSTNIMNLKINGLTNYIPIDKIRDFEIFFYSNIFDANNLIKYPSKIHNISTNALLDSFDTQSSGITNYKIKNNQSQILFTIINQKELELSDFVKIPKYVYLKLNESLTESIYNKKSKEDRKYQEALDYMIQEFLKLSENDSERDEFEEEKEILRKVFNYTYNKIIQWMENLLDAIENESFKKGEIHWDKTKFNIFWNQIQSDLEVERSVNSIKLFGNIDSITAAQLELLKENISSISQNEINKEYETLDKIINNIIVKVDQNITDSDLNILGTERELIKDKLNEFFSDNLDIDFLLNESEVEDLRSILEELTFNAFSIKEELHNWLEEFLDLESNNMDVFLDKVEEKFIFLLTENSVLKEVDVVLYQEKDYHYSEFARYQYISNEINFNNNIDSERVARNLINNYKDDFYLTEDHDFNNELELLSEIEEEFTFIEDKEMDNLLVNSENLNETKMEYINKIIKMFKNFYNPMIEHLNIVRELIYKVEVKSRQVRIKTNDELLKLYVENYNEENFFNLEWRNLSSGEYSILNFFTRFYELNLSINSESNILVVIDEGELYFHPQWQKKYVNILSNMFNNFLPNNHVQVLITSHSPFVVSDLPHYNLILLKKENTDSMNSIEGLELERTFGGNIQDLFSNAFFIQGGLTGEFSKNVINNAISEILINSENAYKKQNEYKRLFDLIGEPLVRNKCLEILNESVQKHRVTSKNLEEEIIELKERLKYLESYK